MSRTDKTAPWRVKQTSDALAYDFESLPGRFTRQPKWWVGEARCGCPLCADQQHRRLQARRERRAGRTEARLWWKA